MKDVNTVSQGEPVETEATVITTIKFPKPVWNEVKKAAVDAEKTASQFVIDTMAEKVGAA